MKIQSQSQSQSQTWTGSFVLMVLMGLLLLPVSAMADSTDDGAPLMCPILNVRGPIEVEDVKKPEWTFSASVAGTTDDVIGSMTYNWTVSDGVIFSGQGTPSIKTARPANGGMVTATVEINSPHFSTQVCPITKSATAVNFLTEEE